jgi:hypothetical protein
LKWLARDVPILGIRYSRGETAPITNKILPRVEFVNARKENDEVDIHRTTAKSNRRSLLFVVVLHLSFKHDLLCVSLALPSSRLQPPRKVSFNLLQVQVQLQ